MSKPKAAICITVTLFVAWLFASSVDAAAPNAVAVHQTLAPLSGGGPALTKQRYEVRIKSFDGTEIAATVFVPDAPANTPVPLVLHSNCWSYHKMATLEPAPLLGPALYLAPEKAAKLANDNGYFLISFNERGWFTSGGIDQFMQPQYEGRDIQAVLDWAEQNLGPQLARRNGKLVAGAFGFSYGGMFQTTGASLDDRIAVITPTLIPYDMVDALAPGPDQTPKSQWIDLLAAGGLAGTFGRLSPLLYKGAVVAQRGVADADLLEVGRTGVGMRPYCTGVSTDPAQRVPAIPAFIVNGWRDSLFNANQAFGAANCLRQTGADVRVLVQQFGHQIPIQQPFPKGGEDGLLAIGMQSQINCGNQKFALADALYSFIDEHIRGSGNTRGPHVDVPTNCFTLDKSNGVVLDQLPVATMHLDVPETTTTDRVFVSLYTASAQRDLVGIPHLRGTLSSPSNAPYAFFGIGYRAAGTTEAELVDGQVLPVASNGTFDVDLVGIAQRLQDGDELGLIISNNDPQFSYFTARSKRPPAITVSGSLILPLLP